MLTGGGGGGSKGASRAPALLESPLRANRMGEWKVRGRRVLQSPEGVHFRERAPSGFGRTQVEHELATLIRGEDLGGVLGDCPLLYLSDIAWLGQAHGHHKLAAGVWRGDGPFRYEPPNKIPVPEANSTSQMDEVRG